LNWLVNSLKSADTAAKKRPFAFAAEAEVVGHVVDRGRDFVIGAAVEGCVLVAVALLSRVARVQHQVLVYWDLEAGAVGLAHVVQVEGG
jgi:hypothetical protein